MKKQTGIWLDFKGADIIHLEKDQPRVEHIASEIEDYHLVGGARSKVPYGPMDKTSESKLLQRRKQQSQRYYQQIVRQLEGRDELLVMGPAEAKIGLREYFKKQSMPGPQLLDVRTADAMTLNQKIAAVKQFFK